MNVTSKFEHYACDKIQITEITINFEEDLNYQFKHYVIFLLVILFIICNIVILIFLLRI